MRARLLLVLAAVTAMLVAALAVPLGLVYAREARVGLERGTRNDALVLSLAIAPSLAEGDVSDIARRSLAHSRRARSRVVVVGPSGDALVDTDAPREGPRSFASRPEVAAALEGEVVVGRRSSETLGADLVYAAAPVPGLAGGEPAGAVRVTVPGDVADGAIRRAWAAIAAAAAVAVAAAALAGLALARWATGPLVALDAVARRLGDGDMSARAGTSAGPPEVRRLAASLDDTAARLDRLVAAQRSFVGEASHQLRSPLTAMRLRLENLEASVEAGAPRAGDVAAAIAELDRLGAIVDGLLAVARAEGSATPSRDVDVAELVAARIEAWQPLLDERGIDVRRTALGGHPVARSEEGRLAQILDNLLSNAVEVSPSGSSIDVSVATVGDVVEVHIADQGPGLGAEERERAFDRFWRSPGGRPDASGSGLGLPIARRLAEVDGGTVRLEARADGDTGLAAVVALRRSGAMPAPAAAGGAGHG